MGSVADLENKPNESFHRYKGIDYHLREVPIGKFDEIQKLATKQILDENGNLLGERKDDVLQMRMLVAASIVTPAGVDLSKLPTSVIFALNAATNKLHDAAIDELPEAVATTTGAAEGGEGTGKG